jgi:hypothetical protein
VLDIALDLVDLRELPQRDALRDERLHPHRDPGGVPGDRDLRTLNQLSEVKRDAFGQRRFLKRMQADIAGARKHQVGGGRVSVSHEKKSGQTRRNGCCTDCMMGLQLMKFFG